MPARWHIPIHQTTETSDQHAWQTTGASAALRLSCSFPASIGRCMEHLHPPSPAHYESTTVWLLPLSSVTRESGEGNIISEGERGDSGTTAQFSACLRCTGIQMAAQRNSFSLHLPPSSPPAASSARPPPPAHYQAWLPDGWDPAGSGERGRGRGRGRLCAQLLSSSSQMVHQHHCHCCCCHHSA